MKAPTFNDVSLSGDCIVTARGAAEGKLFSVMVVLETGAVINDEPMISFSLRDSPANFEYTSHPFGSPEWNRVVPSLHAAVQAVLPEYRRKRQKLEDMRMTYAKKKRLQKSAAELLEALQKVVRQGGLHPDLADECRAVIAKATGNS